MSYHFLNKSIWFKLLILLSIFILFFILYKKFFPVIESEGFVQNEKFVVKYNDQIYDGFYSEIYDKINKTESRMKTELSIIVNLTQADPNHSVILEIGSGTGYAVNELTEMGYKAFGVDRSRPMIEYSENKFPQSNYKCGNVEEPILFEKNTFTHMLCLYYTVYHFKDKVSFFRNCFHWLQTGGYLIIHLVDPDTFDPTVPGAKHIIFGSPKNKKKDKNTIDSVIDFSDFKYKSSYQYNKETKQANITETFQDTESSKIRQNEQILYMENIQDIISTAAYSGFTLKGKVDLKESMMDGNQFLYFFEKLL